MKLRVVSFRLPEDQVEFLKKLPNASEWVRTIIAEKMAEELKDEDRKLNLIRRLNSINQEIMKISDEPEYSNARFELFRYERLLPKISKIRQELENFQNILKKAFETYGTSIEIYLNLFNEYRFKIFYDENFSEEVKKYLDISLKESSRYNEDGRLEIVRILHIKLDIDHDLQERIELDISTVQKEGFARVFKVIDDFKAEIEADLPLNKKIVEIYRSKIRKLEEERDKIKAELLKTSE